MFSGIIQSIGVISSSPGELERGTLKVCASFFLQKDIAIGDSVAVSGVCLTLREVLGDNGVFDLSSETKNKTTFGKKSARSPVNLERSLRVGQGVDGHFVLGHVDAVFTVLSDQKVDENTWRTEFSSHESALIAEKGSIAIDGVSLTTCEVSDRSFCVYVVPFTREHTTLGSLSVGDVVNIEYDCLARYVQAALRLGAS